MNIWMKDSENESPSGEVKWRSLWLYVGDWVWDGEETKEHLESCMMEGHE